MVITFLIPGTIITLVALRKNNIDFIQFLLYALILGLVSHTLLSAFSINPLLFLGLLILFTKSYEPSWWNKLTQISFSAYDGAVIILTIILLIFISNQVAALPNEYFNPASDQYYWLDQAKNPDSNRGFAYIIASLTPSISEDIKTQQNFILSWIYFVYALKILAIAQLARILIPVPSLALLAPLILFSFHWENYYILSTAVVPQNLGIPLFIIGFLLIHKKQSPIFTALFLTIFYFIYLPSLIIFLIAIGASFIILKLLSKISILVQKSAANAKNAAVSTTLIIALPLTIMVIIRYLIYWSQILPFRDPSGISYYELYLKPFGLWSQPYLDFYSQSIILLALLGFLLALIYALTSQKASAALFPFIVSFALAFIYLKTPLLTYHAFYASWQPFRYYFYLIPGLAIFSLFPIALLIKNIKIGKFIAPALLLIIIPPLLLAASKQQSFVFLDMIKGRTPQATELIEQIKNEKNK